MFPYVVTKTIFNMLYSLFPTERSDRFTQGFRDSLTLVLYLAMTGLDVSPEIHNIAFRRMFPTDLPLPSHGPARIMPVRTRQASLCFVI